MSTAPATDLPALADHDFEALRAFVLRETGVSLASTKRMLVQARLGRRVKALGVGSFERYLELLQSPQGSNEYDEFVGAITTHTTHFWREAHHFAVLKDRVLAPALARAQGKLRVWCAASSTGEEPYCLAMTIADALGPELSRWDVRILATDIDARSLETASRAVYRLEDVTEFDSTPRHFLKGKGKADGEVLVRPHLRALLTFRKLNLIDPAWMPRTTFDAIFLRNVLIYFSPDAQLAVVRRLSGFLSEGGLLVLGHAESMVGMRAGLQMVGQGVFERRGTP